MEQVNADYSETKKCPACAELILLDAKKCKHCGEVLGDWEGRSGPIEVQTESKDGKVVRNTLLALGVVIALVAAVFGAALVFDSTRNSSVIPQLESMAESKVDDLRVLGLLDNSVYTSKCISAGISWFGRESRFECVLQDRAGNVVVYDASSNWSTGVLSINLKR